MKKNQSGNCTKRLLMSHEAIRNNIYWDVEQKVNEWKSEWINRYKFRDEEGTLNLLQRMIKHHGKFIMKLPYTTTLTCMYKSEDPQMFLLALKWTMESMKINHDGLYDFQSEIGGLIAHNLVTEFLVDEKEKLTIKA